MLGGWLYTKQHGHSDLGGKGDDTDLREPLLRQQDDDLLNRSPLAVYTAKQPPPHSVHTTSKRPLKGATQSAFVYGVIPTLRTLTMVQASVLGVLAALAGSVSSSGALLLTFLLMTRLYAPSCVEIVRPLSFEYGEHGATAIAHLLQPSSGNPTWMDTLSTFGTSTDQARACSSAVLPFDATAKRTDGRSGGGYKGQLESERALPPEQKVSVSVTLQVPPQYRPTLFQVTGELLSDTGAPLARATRSWLSKPISMAERARRLVFGWPLVLLGLVDDTKHLDMVLLPVYTEKEDQPAVAFRARLTGRTPMEGAPSVYGGEVRVRLLLTWRQELLHALRPSPLMTVVLAVVGLSMMLGGGTAFVIVGGAAWFVYRWGRGSSGSSKRGGCGGATALEDSAMLDPNEHEWMVLAGKGGKGYGGSSNGHGGSSSYGGEPGGSPLHKTPSMGSFFIVNDGASAGAGGSASAGGSPRYSSSQLLGREGGASNVAGGAGAEWSSDTSDSRHNSPAG